MEIRNHATNMVMRPALRNMLEQVRRARGFNAARVIAAKATILNHYLRQANLKSVVVAVSGGIDSAVVLGLAKIASDLPDSPIQKIVAISLPSHGTKGVTGQILAQSDAQLVADKFGIPLSVVDMKPIVDTITRAVEGSTGLESNTWAEGQVVSYARTPTYYYVTSLLAANKMPGVVLGTTNLSEGGYLGYFGKASDGMVDIQLISDLYKNEVYEIAKLLNVPQAIIKKPPTGDMFDATTDEVVFGAPYDFVELYQELLRRWNGVYKNPDVMIGQYLNTTYDYEWADPDNGFSTEDKEQFKEYAANLERMHAYNAHKYLGRSPAVHLDIMPCAVPGGWDNSGPELPELEIDYTRLVNHQKFEEDVAIKLSWLHRPEAKPLGKLPKDHGIMIPSFLSEEEATNIKQATDTFPWLAVPLDGIKVDRELEDEEIGSWRATVVNHGMAFKLWNRLQPLLPTLRVMDETTPTDHDDHPVWRPVGISPVFRFIKYAPGGMLVPHYDSTFVENKRRRTLMSMVVYLSNSPGGETRFIRDLQADVPVNQRDLSDWTREPKEEEILFQVQPENGLAILFDHRILHDGAKIQGNDDKLIFRTDVVFERCDWYSPE